MKRRRLPALSLLVLAFPVSAAAQPAKPGAAPPPPPAAAPLTAPAQATPEPNLPDVNDPMLTPVPAAKNTLTSWQQALRLSRSQNSSLRIAIARAELAQAQSRQVLSRSLPT